MQILILLPRVSTPARLAAVYRRHLRIRKVKSAPLDLGNLLGVFSSEPTFPALYVSLGSMLSVSSTVSWQPCKWYLLSCLTNTLRYAVEFITGLSNPNSSSPSKDPVSIRPLPRVQDSRRDAARLETPARTLFAFWLLIIRYFVFVSLSLNISVEAII